MSSKQVIEKTLNFSRMESMSINDDLCVLIPDGFRVVDYSALPDYADSMVIVPKNLQQEADPSDAELALIIQTAPIPCGMTYNPEKESMYTELFTTYYPVFTDEKAVNVLAADKGRGILYQFSSGTDPVAWCKYHGIIFVKRNAYFFHLASSQVENASSASMESEFHHRAGEWLEMILHPNEYMRIMKQHTQQVRDEVTPGKQQEKVECGYLTWLTQRVSKERWVEFQLAYETIERFCNKYHILDEPLLETVDLAQISQIQNVIMTRKDFTQMGQNKRYTCGLAMRYYKEYLGEMRERTAEDLQIQSADPEEIALRQKEAEECRLREEEQARQRREVEARMRREAEIARQQKEAEEHRLHEAELARQQKKEEEYKSRYYNLLHQLQEQERIVSENRGWFGIQAKRRKAAQMCIREIKAKLASEYPAGLARKHTD